MTALELLRRTHASVGFTIDQLKAKVTFPEPMSAREYIGELPGEDLDNLTAQEVIEMAEWEAEEDTADEVVRSADKGGMEGIPLEKLGEAFTLISRHLDRDGARLYDRRWISGFYNMHQQFKEFCRQRNMSDFLTEYDKREEFIAKERLREEKVVQSKGGKGKGKRTMRESQSENLQDGSETGGEDEGMEASFEQDVQMEGEEKGREEVKGDGKMSADERVVKMQWWKAAMGKRLV